MTESWGTESRFLVWVAWFQYDCIYNSWYSKGLFFVSTILWLWTFCFYECLTFNVFFLKLAIWTLLSFDWYNKKCWQKLSVSV